MCFTVWVGFFLFVYIYISVFLQVISEAKVSLKSLLTLQGVMEKCLQCCRAESGGCDL